MKLSQKDRILDYLQGGHRISQSDALSWFGCSRLAARIEEIRRDGFDVETVMVEVNGKKFASYRLRRAR